MISFTLPEDLARTLLVQIAVRIKELGEVDSPCHIEQYKELKKCFDIITDALPRRL
jgi:hypothetical protein